VRDAGISICSGGIIGLGEEAQDRVGLIWEMSRLPEPPESFPVNALVPIPGTPLGENEVRWPSGVWRARAVAIKHSAQRVTIHEMLRTIATARIVLPTCVYSPLLVCRSECRDYAQLHHPFCRWSNFLH
jgi:biotin synthase